MLQCGVLYAHWSKLLERMLEVVANLRQDVASVDVRSELYSSSVTIVDLVCHESEYESSLLFMDVTRGTSRAVLARRYRVFQLKLLRRAHRTISLCLLTAFV